MSESMQRKAKFLSIAEPEQILPVTVKKTEQPGEKIRWKIKKNGKQKKK